MLFIINTNVFLFMSPSHMKLYDNTVTYKRHFASSHNIHRRDIKSHKQLKDKGNTLQQLRYCPILSINHLIFIIFVIIIIIILCSI